MVSSRRDATGELPIHLYASLGFISDENAHPNIDRGSGEGSKRRKDAIMFGSKPNKAVLNAPTLPPWLSAAAWQRRGSKSAATMQETRIIPPKRQQATSGIQGNTTDPAWSIEDFQEVMLRGFEVEAGAVDGDCDVGLHRSSSPLFRWVIVSSRLLSGEQEELRKTLILCESGGFHPSSTMPPPPTRCLHPSLSSSAAPSCIYTTLTSLINFRPLAGACTPKQPLPPLPLDQAPPPPSARAPDHNVWLRAPLPVSRPMRAARRKPMRIDIVRETDRCDASLPSSSGAGDVASRSTLHTLGYRIPHTWLIKGGVGVGGQEEEGSRESVAIGRRNRAGEGQAGGATSSGRTRTAAAASSPDSAAELSTCSTVARGEEEGDTSSSSPHGGHLDAADLGFCASACMKPFMRSGGARGVSPSPSSSRSHCGAGDVGSWSAAPNRKRVDLRGRYETSLESSENPPETLKRWWHPKVVPFWRAVMTKFRVPGSSFSQGSNHFVSVDSRPHTP